MSVTEFSADYLDSLTGLALASPRRRQHRNVHADYTEQVQRLFNAIEPDSYIRPHQHGLAPRREMMIAIRGRLALIVFDDAGNISTCHHFAANQPDTAVGVEVPVACWHTVVGLEPGSILLEIKAGPFDPLTPKEMAPWAPEEGTAAASNYLEMLRAQSENTNQN